MNVAWNLSAVAMSGLAVACACAAHGGDAQNVNPPNVVLVLVDDLGWADLGCYGSTYYETPNLDRLASQGMRFTNAYAACAVCSPTRAAVMTGRYPARLGVTDWIRARFQGSTVPADRKNPTEYVGGPGRRLLCPPNALWMESDEITIAEILKEAGYTTCHIGKWHLGFDDWYPDRQGFDVNIGGCDMGHPPSYFDPYSNPRDGGIPTLAPRREGEYLTDREADEAVGFISAHTEEPFFLYWAPYAVHTPLQAKAELIAKYKAKQPTHQTNATYAAMVESVDAGVGRIMNTLDQLDLAERTLVIFTSDNGGLLGPTNNAPLRSGKGYPYEGGIREPLIVRWPPRVPARSECNEPVTSVDYLPTICEAAGLAPPAHRPIDGRSIVPLLTGSGAWQRDALFWHFPHYRGKDVVPYSIVRAGDWKLIKRYEGKTYEVFNLRQDIGETNDLSDSMPEKVRELDEKLQAWLSSVRAKLPKPNPAWEGDDADRPQGE
jgi:arylsulfatase A